MLLETLDIKKNDVLIFSRNILSLGNNFKIIYKDDPKKEPHDISYKQVCSFVNEYTPKNMIVYRLLTNIEDFGIYLSKYGYYLNINGITELIYFDPVFAIRELEDYTETINYYDLRFRIQQVGLTTLNRKDELPNYAEIYSIDLEANEARFQNDMAFADAIFVFDKEGTFAEGELNKKGRYKETKIMESYSMGKKPAGKPETRKRVIDEKKPGPQVSRTNGKREQINRDIKNVKKTEPSKKTNTGKIVLKEVKKNISTKPSDGIKIIKHEISEDENFDYKQIKRVNFKSTAVTEKEHSVSDKIYKENVSRSSEKPDRIVPSLIKHKNNNIKTFGSFLRDTQTYHNSGKSSKPGTDEDQSMIVDIFKSPESLKDYLAGKKNKKVVLKMSKK